MSKLFAVIDGLISVVESQSNSGSVKLLFLKTYPDDLDANGKPFPDHKPQISFSSAGVAQTVPLLGGMDLRIANGHRPAQPSVVKDLARLPSFSAILAGKLARPQDAYVAQGCATSGGTCTRSNPIPQPRIAARLFLDQGKLSTIQVDEHSVPVKSPPARWRFVFENDVKQAALDMPCDNALLLEMDLGQGNASLQIGNRQPVILDKASPAEQAKIAGLVGADAQDCVLVQITDMVDPALLKKMHMDAMMDAHFSVFFDLLPSYHGPKVIPTLVKPKGASGFPLLNRCIPPRMLEP